MHGNGTYVSLSIKKPKFVLLTCVLRVGDQRIKGLKKNWIKDKTVFSHLNRWPHGMQILKISPRVYSLTLLVLNNKKQIVTKQHYSRENHRRYFRRLSICIGLNCTDMKVSVLRRMSTGDGQSIQCILYKWSAWARKLFSRFQDFPNK